MTASFPVSERNKVRRLHELGRYDKGGVYAVLDAAMLCHIAYVIDGQPYCTPTAFWREGDHLYWHGSSASRMLRRQKPGLPVCLTVIGMTIDEASAKVRSKGVADEEEDYGLPIYAARFPVRQVVGEVEACPSMPTGVERPEGLAGFTSGRRLDEVMSENYHKTYAT